MSLFDFFTKKKNTTKTTEPDYQVMIEESNRKSQSFDVTDISTIDRNDFNGLAANASYITSQAIKNKDYDKAWENLHIMKDYYLSSAKRQKLTKAQTYSLLSGVEVSFANVLRLEKKYNDSLAHIILALITTDYQTKALQKSLSLHLKRAKLSIDDIDKANNYINKIRNDSGWIDLESIRVEIFKWQGIVEKLKN